MRISNVDVRDVNDGVRLSANIDDFTLWFHFPWVHQDEIRADGLIAALLIPAMVAGQPLVFTQPIPHSPKLLQGTSKIQSIFHSWNPVFRKIAIEAGPAVAPPERNGVASFFSGGLDGTFTFLRHSDELQYVILINGFDFSCDTATFVKSVDRNRCFAERFGKILLPVQTNYIELGKKLRLSRAASYGGLLASIALNIGLRKTYIASAYGYVDMPPQGSHPMLDHLWNTETSELVHDGTEASRTEKISLISSNEAALTNLRVCWRDINENCGECSKCLRTMIALRLLNQDERLSFPRRTTLADVRRFAVTDDSSRGFAADNLALAERTGNKKIAALLRSSIRKYDLRRLAVDYDQLFLGGLTRSVRSWFRSRMKPEDAPDIWPSAHGH